MGADEKHRLNLGKVCFVVSILSLFKIAPTFDKVRKTICPCWLVYFITTLASVDFIEKEWKEGRCVGVVLLLILCSEVIFPVVFIPLQMRKEFISHLSHCHIISTTMFLILPTLKVLFVDIVPDFAGETSILCHNDVIQV